MKKLILLLLFIPLFSFGQTYKDVMSINSADMFKKVVIENKYQYTLAGTGLLQLSFPLFSVALSGSDFTGLFGVRKRGYSGFEI